MKVKKAIVWALVNANEWHPSTPIGEQTVGTVGTIVLALFPGVDYDDGPGASGLGQVMRTCAVPALRGLYPDLVAAPAESISADDTVELNELLPSEGYEWQTDKWRARFNELVV